MTIRTAKDWWDLVDKQWGPIMEILSHHLDMNHPAYEVPGDASSRMTSRTIAAELALLKNNRDYESGHTLCRYFNAVWGMASEAYCWSVPGWGDFCDLCSEEWSLDEE